MSLFYLVDGRCPGDAKALPGHRQGDATTKEATQMIESNWPHRFMCLYAPKPIKRRTVFFVDVGEESVAECDNEERAWELARYYRGTVRAHTIDDNSAMADYLHRRDKQRRGDFRA